MNNKDQIEETVKRWWEGWAKKDIQVLEDIAHEDYIEFTGGSKRSQGKQALLETARRVMPHLDLLEWEIREALVIPFGDTALCNYYYSEAGNFKGNAYQAMGCATDVFVKLGESWKLVCHHVTEIHSPTDS